MSQSISKQIPNLESYVEKVVKSRKEQQSRTKSERDVEGCRAQSKVVYFCYYEYFPLRKFKLTARRSRSLEVMIDTS